MKWFEHRTDAAGNKKIRKIEIFYKARGGQAVMAAMGRFWRLLEIVGEKGLRDDGLDSFSLPTDYGLEVLADDLWCSLEELREFLNLLAQINSIDTEAWEKAEKIFIPKLAERADNYTKKLNKIRREQEGCSNTVRTMSEEGKDKVPTGCGECLPPQSQSQELITPPPPPLTRGGDERESDFLEWKKNWPPERSTGWLGAEKVWKRLARQGKLRPLGEMLAVLAAHKRSESWQREEGRFIPLPERYLAKGRFLDESIQAREPPAACCKCGGTGFRRAEAGETSIGGQRVCECRDPQWEPEEARAP